MTCRSLVRFLQVGVLIFFFFHEVRCKSCTSTRSTQPTRHSTSTANGALRSKLRHPCEPRRARRQPSASICRLRPVPGDEACPATRSRRASPASQAVASPATGPTRGPRRTAPRVSRRRSVGAYPPSTDPPRPRHDSRSTRRRATSPRSSSSPSSTSSRSTSESPGTPHHSQSSPLLRPVAPRQRSTPSSISLPSSPPSAAWSTNGARRESPKRDSERDYLYLYSSWRSSGTSSARSRTTQLGSSMTATCGSCGPLHPSLKSGLCRWK